MHLKADNPNLAELCSVAVSLGASAAILLPACALVVAERFAALCAAPHRCPSYGLAPGCPPRSMSPGTFRAELHQYQYALVFKIDTPASILMGPGRLDKARAIHCIAAQLEQQALALGFSPVRGLASGSCKELFCPEMETCVAPCYPCPLGHPARPSLSALGLDFSALAQCAGWSLRWFSPAAPAEEPESMGMLAGLVLLGALREDRSSTQREDGKMKARLLSALLGALCLPACSSRLTSSWPRTRSALRFPIR